MGRCFGRGRGRGLGFGLGVGRGFMPAAVSQPTKEGELEGLKAYSQELETELSGIRKRIAELGKQQKK